MSSPTSPQLLGWKVWHDYQWTEYWLWEMAPNVFPQGGRKTFPEQWFSVLVAHWNHLGSLQNTDPRSQSQRFWFNWPMVQPEHWNFLNFPLLILMCSWSWESLEQRQRITCTNQPKEDILPSRQSNKSSCAAQPLFSLTLLSYILSFFLCRTLNSVVL